MYSNCCVTLQPVADLMTQLNEKALELEVTLIVHVNLNICNTVEKSEDVIIQN